MKKSILLVVAMVFVFTFAGCFPRPCPDSNDQKPPLPAQSGSLQLVLFGQKDLSDAAVAAIIERLKGQILEVAIALNDGTQIINRKMLVEAGTTVVNFAEIPIGSYDLVVDLYNDQSRIFSGNTAVNITAGDLTVVSVAVQPTPYSFQFYVYNLAGNFQDSYGNLGVTAASFELDDGSSLPIFPVIGTYGNGTHTASFRVDLPLSETYGKLVLVDFDDQISEVEINFEWFDLFLITNGTIWVNAQSNGAVLIDITLPETGAATLTVWESEGMTNIRLDPGSQDLAELFPGCETAPLEQLLLHVGHRGEMQDIWLDPPFPINLSVPYVVDSLILLYKLEGSNAIQFADTHVWFATKNGKLINDSSGLWLLADRFIRRDDGIEFNSLQELINQTEGPIIAQLGEGAYGGFILPADRFLQLTGAGANRTWLINPGYGFSQVIYASSMGGPSFHKGGGPAVSLQNLGVYNGEGYTDSWYSDAAVFVEGGIHLSMINCVVESRSNKCLGLNYQTSYISHCVFRGWLQQYDAIASYRGTLLTNSSVFEDFSEVFHLEFSTPTTNNNCLNNYQAVSNVAGLPTPGYIFAPPQLGADYVASPGSPCINGGGEGIDIGLDYTPPI